MRLPGLLALCIVCASCGGGGGGGGGGDLFLPRFTADSGSVESYPAFSQAPANNAAMDTCTSTAAPDPASDIRGTISYERVPVTTSGLDFSTIQTLPARGVVVQAVAAPGGVCGSTVVATALTNANGDYGLTIPDKQAVCIEVRAQMYRDGGGGGPSWDFQVVDNTSRGAGYYLVDGTPMTPTTPLNGVDYVAEAGADPFTSSYPNPRAAAPFAILDSICEALDKTVDAVMDIALPTLKLNWSENNIAASGDAADGEIGGAYFREIRYIDQYGTVVDREFDIFLLGDATSGPGGNTDEYDPHVINHEFGHYLVAVVSRSDTIGGEHAEGDRLDPRVAFDEGFATAIAGITLDTSFVPNPVVADGLTYIDSMIINDTNTFHFPIDSNSTSTVGWYSESTVHSTVFNAYDSNPEIWDSLNFSLPDLLNVLTSNSYKNSESLLTLFTFFYELKQQHSGSSSAIDVLLAQELTESIADHYGTGELVAMHDVAGKPDLEDILPVYLTLSSGAPARRACSNDVFQTYSYYNKLGNGRFLRFSPPVSGTYRFQIAPETGGWPVVKLYQKGKLLLEKQTTSPGDTLSFEQSLSASEGVVMVLYDYDNLNGGIHTGRWCFGVTVNGI